MFKIESVALQRGGVVKGLLMRPDSWHVSFDLGLLATTMGVSNQPSSPLLPREDFPAYGVFSSQTLVPWQVRGCGFSPRLTAFVKNNCCFFIIWRFCWRVCVRRRRCWEGQSQRRSWKWRMFWWHSSSYDHSPLSQYREVWHFHPWVGSLWIRERFWFCLCSSQLCHADLISINVPQLLAGRYTGY